MINEKWTFTQCILSCSGQDFSVDLKSLNFQNCSLHFSKANNIWYPSCSKQKPKMLLFTTVKNDYKKRSQALKSVNLSFNTHKLIYIYTVYTNHILYLDFCLSLTHFLLRLMGKQCSWLLWKCPWYSASFVEKIRSLFKFT